MLNQWSLIKRSKQWIVFGFPSCYYEDFPGLDNQAEEAHNLARQAPWYVSMYVHSSIASGATDIRCWRSKPMGDDSEYSKYTYSRRPD